MKLGFDATSVALQGKGLARFQREFLDELARLRLVDDLTVFIAESANVPVASAAGWTHVEVRTSPMVRWEQIGLPRAARRLRLDAVVTTSERAALWGPPRVPYVFEHPRHRAARDRHRGVGGRQRAVNALTLALFPAAMRRATAVLVSSEATRRDLARYVDASVVHPGVSRSFSPDAARAAAARDRYAAGEPYVLHIASDDPRENSETVVAALAALAARGDRPPLVIAGPIRERRPALEEALRRDRLADRVTWLGFVSGDDLVDLYRGALAYVDPSLYEGFGLQALESLACGVPAVTSDRTSLPEVVGEAGFLLDAYDADGFADALHRLLHEPGLRADLRERALARAARFTWERTVRETLEHVRRAVS